jgi:hypothetical protein
MSKTKNDWELIENRGLYYFLDKKGQIASEKLFEKKSSIQVLVPLPGRRVGMPISVYGESLVSLSDENLIYSAWSTDFLIKIYGPDGEYERAFYYPSDEVPLTAESISKVGSQLLQKGMSSMDLPESWPVLNTLIVDDENRLWVSTTVKDHEVYEWWVLRKNGEVITKFEWPRNKSVEEVRNGYVYTRETEEETGLQQIVRYSFEID